MQDLPTEIVNILKKQSGENMKEAILAKPSIKYTIYGMIVGPKLPSTPTRIGNFFVGQKPESASCLIRPKCIIELGDTPHYQGLPGELKVSSNRFIWSTYEGVTLEEAVQKANFIDLPALLTSLTTACDGIYCAQLHGVEECINGTCQNNTLHSNTMNFYKYSIEEMSDSDISTAKKIYSACETDGFSLRAAQYITSAFEIEHTSGDSKDQKSAALLLYFKSIECQRLSLPEEINTENLEEKNRIIENLKKIICSSKCIDKKINAIDTAKKNIDKISSKNIGNSIINTAKRINISEAWISECNEFIRLRNKKLGHQGNELSMAEISRWCGNGTEGIYTARKLALDFLHQRLLFNTNKTD